MSVQVGDVISLSHIDIGAVDDLPSAAEISVARTLRERQSNCTACASDEKGEGGECKSCGSKKNATPEASDDQHEGKGKTRETAKSSDSKQSGKDGKQHQDKRTPQNTDKDGNEISYLIEVEFKGRRKQLYRNERPLELALGDLVVVEAERGIDAGHVCAMGRIATDRLRVAYNNEKPLFAAVRRANKKDRDRYEQNQKAEKEAFSVYKERVKAFNLEMKPVDAEWQFDHHRLTFFFTAPKQVDFRQLVRDLASIFSTRIELRQISPRDESKRVGGLGICGRELCCSTFLNRFEYINLDHAKVQQLAQNPTKLSGLCGRLKCCLLYEIDYYVSALKNYPPLDSEIRTPEGNAKIFKIDIFKDQVHLYYARSSTYDTLSLPELNKLRKAGKVKMPRQPKPA